MRRLRSNGILAFGVGIGLLAVWACLLHGRTRTPEDRSYPEGGVLAAGMKMGDSRFKTPSIHSRSPLPSSVEPSPNPLKAQQENLDPVVFIKELPTGMQEMLTSFDGGTRNAFIERFSRPAPVASLIKRLQLNVHLTDADRDVLDGIEQSYSALIDSMVEQSAAAINAALSSQVASGGFEVWKVSNEPARSEPSHKQGAYSFVNRTGIPPDYVLGITFDSASHPEVEARLQEIMDVLRQIDEERGAYLKGLVKAGR